MTHRTLRHIMLLLAAIMLPCGARAQDSTAVMLSPGGYWWLHKGLNLQLDLGVAVGFGKHNPYRHGAFYNDISAIYVTESSDSRLRAALGGTLSNTTVGGESYVSASAEAMMAYRLNERLTALAFASYTMPLTGQTDNRRLTGRMAGRYAAMQLRRPYYLPYGTPATDARFTPGMTMGGGVDYKVTESFHIGVSASWTVVNDCWGMY